MAFWDGRSVLVTGISGFIGAWLARALVEAGARVVGFDTDPRGALALHEGLEKRLEVVSGSVLSKTDLARVMSQHEPNTCFHLAGASSVESTRKNPLSAFDVNARAVWVLLDVLRGAPRCPDLILASSNHVYGTHGTFPYTEDFALNGLGPYAASKACGDIVARCFAATYGMPLVVARLTNTFGGADPHLTHVVTASILAILRGEAPVVQSDGSPLKSYLYVQDTIQGFLRLAEHVNAPEVCGEAFNLTPDEPVTVIDLVRTVARVSGVAGLDVQVIGEPGTFHEREALSNARMRSQLGWAPKYSLEEGLRETFDWYRRRPESWQA